MFFDWTWRPVCTVCHRASRNQAPRTLAGVEAGEGYAFRSKMGAKSGRRVRVLKGEPLALPLFPGCDA